jgi:hypothetical protein
METDVLSRQWLAAIEYVIQNASNTRVALKEGVRAIGEQMDFIISMDMNYIWSKSHRELAEMLTNETTDEFCRAMWSFVESILDLHDRSEILDDSLFEEEVETAVQPFYQHQLANSSPNEHLWANLLVGCVAFAQGWSMGHAES